MSPCGQCKRGRQGLYSSGRMSGVAWQQHTCIYACVCVRVCAHARGSSSNAEHVQTSGCNFVLLFPPMTIYLTLLAFCVLQPGQVVSYKSSKGRWEVLNGGEGYNVLTTNLEFASHPKYDNASYMSVKMVFLAGWRLENPNVTSLFVTVCQTNHAMQDHVGELIVKFGVRVLRARVCCVSALHICVYACAF